MPSTKEMLQQMPMPGDSQWEFLFGWEKDLVWKIHKHNENMKKTPITLGELNAFQILYQQHRKNKE